MFLPQMDIAYDLGMCQAVFGFNQSEIYGKIDFTNLYYGADRPDGARVIFVNGKNLLKYFPQKAPKEAF